MKFDKIYLVLFFCMLTQILWAQTGTLTAYEAIQSLDSSVLIVRLDMQKKAIDTYQEIFDNPNSSEKQKRMVSKHMTRINAERERYKESVMNAMNDNYFFSEFCFIDNHDVRSFKNGDLSVLNCANDFVVDIVEKDNYYFLVKGDADTEWIFCDKNFQRISHPFPSSHDIGIAKFFNFIVGKDPFNYENMSKVFMKMQKRLDKFLLKSKK